MYGTGSCPGSPPPESVVITISYDSMDRFNEVTSGGFMAEWYPL